MAVFTEESARANVRNREGQRVFYLAEGDRLTPSAREWLRQERIEILPAELAKPKCFTTLDGAQLLAKPEHMTHLRADMLVRKDHPRIRMRGKIDTLEAELLLTARQANELGNNKLVEQLEEILAVVRKMIRCDVLEEPLEVSEICGMTMEQVREKSHHPERYFDQPHFMPSFRDSTMLLQLNRLRTELRAAELSIYDAFQDRDGQCTRQDLLSVMNRLSSLLWIIMIVYKKETDDGRA